MSENTLKELQKSGQSVWFDYVSRDLIASGELKRLVDEDAVTGVTSNPTIFQKAIEGSDDYDNALKEMLSRGVRNEKELFVSLAIEDITRAADILWPVYQSTRGHDGFISIEVSPDLAYDTDSTIEEAKWLFSSIGRKNILIKVPATKEGLPAIELLISEGVNVNVTLLFSVDRYVEVAETYIRGIKKRLSKGQPVSEINSVASFFVSRVDTLTDKLLEERLSTATSEAEKEKIKCLFGRAAVANAKIAYKKYEEIFLRGEFPSLKKKGACVQRLLWGSTGTKNPGYSDIKYVEELIAPDSVNTMPEQTMKAFNDHGSVRMTIKEDIKDAEALFKELALLGVDIKDITDSLEEEGVKLFSDSFFSVLRAIGRKRDMFLSRKTT